MTVEQDWVVSLPQRLLLGCFGSSKVGMGVQILASQWGTSWEAQIS